MAVVAYLVALSTASGGSKAGEAVPAGFPPERAAVMPDGGGLTLLLAGDTIIMQPWSADRAPEFLALIDEIRAADVAIANLETLFHEYKGYAQAQSGGTWLASRPELAAELAWAGIDMVATATNHSFDYGSEGVLENLANVEKAGLVSAGTGRDLQHARAPAYFDHPAGTVALVSTASTFTPYGRASRSRPDMHGRPGLNPLTAAPPFLTSERVEFALERVADVAGIPFRWVDRKDVEANLDAIREARARAGLVVFSIHAHGQGRWLARLARQAIDAGADVFFAHGPHSMRGIEFYKGKPIFYCLGDFVFQNELVERLPSEFYEKLGYPESTTPEEALRMRSGNGTKGFAAKRAPWEAVAAVLRFRGKDLAAVRLVPMDLGFGKQLPVRGKPRYADATLGKRIIDQIGDASRPYGTKIRYLDGENVGVAELDRVR